MDDLFIVYLTHFPRKCILGMWNVLAGENADGLLFASTFSLTVNSAEASLSLGTTSSLQTTRCRVTTLLALSLLG